MPYMGVGIFDGNNKIIIKLHGPLELSISPREIRESAEAIWDNHTTKANNIIPIRVQELADHLRDIFCDGKDILWVNVEYQSPSNGNIFGASAEKVLVEYVTT